MNKPHTKRFTDYLSAIDYWTRLQWSKATITDITISFNLIEPEPQKIFSNKHINIYFEPPEFEQQFTITFHYTHNSPII